MIIRHARYSLAGCANEPMREINFPDETEADGFYLTEHIIVAINSH